MQFVSSGDVLHVMSKPTVPTKVKVTILPVPSRSARGFRSFRSRSTVVPVNIAVPVGQVQSLHNRDHRSVPINSFMFALL